MAANDRQAPELVDMLLDSGVLTKAQLELVDQKKRLFGGTLGLHLLALGYLTEPVLQAYLQQFFQNPEGLSYDSEPEPEALSLLDRDRAARLKVVPLKQEGDRVFVLALNPSDSEAMREVKRRTGKEPVATVVNELRLAWLLDRWYGIAAPAHLAAGIKEYFGAMETGELVVPTAAVDPDDSIIYDPMAGVLDGAENGGPMGLGTPGAEAMENGEEVIPILEEELPLLIIEMDEEEEEALQKEKEHEDMPVGHGLEPLPPAGFDQALAAIESLEELSELFQRFGSVAFKSMAVFKVQGGVIAGWRGAGEGVRAESIREIKVPADGDSLLALGIGPDVLVTDELESDEDSEIAEKMGMGEGEEIMTHAVSVRNRPVLVMAGVLKQGLDSDVVGEDVKTLCNKASAAVVRIILAKKKQKPGAAAEPGAKPAQKAEPASQSSDKKAAPKKKKVEPKKKPPKKKTPKKKTSKKKTSKKKK